MPSTLHIILLLVVVVLLFGTSKLRNLGSDLGGAIDLQHIAHWFRNSLAHVGGLPDRIYLNGGDGPIFVRSPETGEIVSIGLPAFYEAVVQAWHCVRDDFIPGTIKHTDAKPCEPLEESCPPSHLVDATGTSGGPYVTRTSYGQWKRELVWAVKDAPPGSRFEFARVRPL